MVVRSNGPDPGRIVHGRIVCGRIVRGRIVALPLSSMVFVYNSEGHGFRTAQ